MPEDRGSAVLSDLKSGPNISAMIDFFRGGDDEEIQGSATPTVGGDAFLVAYPINYERTRNREKSKEHLPVLQQYVVHV